MQLSYCLLLHVARRLIQAYTHPGSTPVTTAHVWQGRGGVKASPQGAIYENDAVHLSDEA